MIWLTLGAVLIGFMVLFYYAMLVFLGVMAAVLVGVYGLLYVCFEHLLGEPNWAWAGLSSFLVGSLLLWCFFVLYASQQEKAEHKGSAAEPPRTPRENRMLVTAVLIAALGIAAGAMGWFMNKPLQFDDAEEFDSWEE